MLICLTLSEIQYCGSNEDAQYFHKNSRINQITKRASVERKNYHYLAKEIEK